MSDPTDGPEPADLAAPLDIGALGRLAVKVALAAGRLIVDGRPDRLVASATKSSPTDVVTVMDTRSEELIRADLLAARPDDGIHGEEGADHIGTSPVTWVVDPIDGTVNYLYGIPAYAVSIAAVTGDPRTPGKWAVLAAAVADPSLELVYHATLGGGSYATRADGSTRTLHVGGLADLAGALVGTGFGYTPERRREQAALLLEVIPQVRDIRRIGSAALDLCMVASGQLDGFYEIGLNPWDLAAGWLLIEEAGGLVSGPRGGAPAVDLTVAGNPAVHAALAAIVDR